MHFFRRIRQRFSKKSLVKYLIAVTCILVLIVAAVLYFKSDIPHRDSPQQNDQQQVKSSEELVDQMTQGIDDKLQGEADSSIRSALLASKVDAYVSVGKYDDALTAANTLAGDEPTVPTHRATIARLYSMHGRYNKERENYELAISLCDQLPASDAVTAEKAFYQQKIADIGDI